MAERIVNSLDTAALRLLAKKVDEWIKTNADNLAIGSSLIDSDTHATAMAYSGAVSYVRALRDVIGLCQEVEDELRGKK